MTCKTCKDTKQIVLFTSIEKCPDCSTLEDTGDKIFLSVYNAVKLYSGIYESYTIDTSDIKKDIYNVYFDEVYIGKTIVLPTPHCEIRADHINIHFPDNTWNWTRKPDYVILEKVKE